LADLRQTGIGSKFGELEAAEKSAFGNFTATRVWAGRSFP